MIPRKKDLKKLLEGPSRNFCYGMDEDKYLGASTLGSDMVPKKKFHRETGILNGNSFDVSSSCRYVGAKQ